jgi:hypothetical protein
MTPVHKKTGKKDKLIVTQGPAENESVLQKTTKTPQASSAEKTKKNFCLEKAKRHALLKISSISWKFIAPILKNL